MTCSEPDPEFIGQGLGDRPAQRLWRQLVAVDLSFYKSPIAEEIRGEGREEGREEGLAMAILLVLARRGVEVPEDVRERVNACTDMGLLTTWLTRALTATTAEEVVRNE